MLRSPSGSRQMIRELTTSWPAQPGGIRGRVPGWIMATHVPEFWSANGQGVVLSGVPNIENHFPAGKWVFEAVTYDGERIKEYTNGKLVNDWPTTGAARGKVNRWSSARGRRRPPITSEAAWTSFRCLAVASHPKKSRPSTIRAASAQPADTRRGRDRLWARASFATLSGASLCGTYRFWHSVARWWPATRLRQRRTAAGGFACQRPCCCSCSRQPLRPNAEAGATGTGGNRGLVAPQADL